MASIRLSTGGEGIGNQFPLSESVHLTLIREGCCDQPLNCGYGMLYAPSVILPDQTIAERLVSFPGFVHAECGWGIAALRVDLSGQETDSGQLLYWTTEDFIAFDEHGMRPRSDFPEYDPAHPVCEAAIPDEICPRICGRWLARPSGEKPLFPLADGYADPVLFRWKGAWYFLATNDNTDDVGLFIRSAPTMMGLFAPDAKEHCILARNDSLDLVQTFWAPEMHLIGGRITILLAIGGKAWGPQCRMMFLRGGGDPLCAQDWETPVLVCRRDGSPLGGEGITLDMTCVHTPREDYLVWSYREHIGTPMDTGSMLMIARMDRHEPWRLASEPVVLSRPLYAWENRGRTINNEGPYPLYAGEDVYLTYSGGAAGGESYAIGYLKASLRDDLTDPAVWRKSPMPVLHSPRVPGVYGPGHNSFFTDEAGQVWIAYHAQCSPEDRIRRTGMHTVTFDADGTPVFDCRTMEDKGGVCSAK